MSNFSFVSLPREELILRTRMTHDWCNRVEKKAKLFVEDVECNLKNTTRTGWDLHLKNALSTESTELLELVCQGLHNLFYRPYSATLTENKFILATTSAWVAWYNAESSVVPHNHGVLPCQYSFCVYLQTPVEGTTFSFFGEQEGVIGNHQSTLNVQKGDVLVFPSKLPHYVEKLSDNRVIFSGNFTIVPVDVFNDRPDSLT